MSATWHQSSNIKIVYCEGIFFPQKKEQEFEFKENYQTTSNDWTLKKSILNWFKFDVNAVINSLMVENIKGYIINQYEVISMVKRL